MFAGDLHVKMAIKFIVMVCVKGRISHIIVLDIMGSPVIFFFKTISSDWTAEVFYGVQDILRIAISDHEAIRWENRAKFVEGLLNL
ncbi:hypothetical protein SDC9_209603 [bioreactor metagenome]|uniref:Uncharacterized protein n=1 Tax=bioreactor metagenome TaxID=1076179 RepID=A0A645JDR0_9ZZZZ